LYRRAAAIGALLYAAQASAVYTGVTIAPDQQNEIATVTITLTDVPPATVEKSDGDSRKPAGWYIDTAQTVSPGAHGTATVTFKDGQTRTVPVNVGPDGRIELGLALLVPGDQVGIRGGTPSKDNWLSRSQDWPIRIVLEGGAGRSWNPSASCRGVTQQLQELGFDTVNCANHASDTAYVVEGQIRFLNYFGISGGYLDDGSITQRTAATVSSVPGVSANVNGSFGPVRGGTFLGFLILPLSNSFAVTLRGGLQAWGVRSGNTAVFIIPGVPSMTSVVGQKNSGTNPLIEVTIEYWVTPNFGLDAGYAYARYTDGSSVDEKDYKVLLRVKVGLGGSAHAFWKH